jgi:hypothetical protein
VAWFQGAEAEEAVAVFRQLGLPELLRVFDETVAQPPGDWRTKDDLLFLLKIVCMYGAEGGLDRLVSAVQSPQLGDGHLWSVIFGIVSKDEHPWQIDLVEALRKPLPSDFAGVAYLDLCNTVARSGRLSSHPFDSDAGFARLAAWLSDRGEGHSSYGHSAAASIPFLSPERRGKVQELANRHPDRAVQLEAAWAAAACGEARGYQTLQSACADPRHASSAMEYLRELGAADRIPLHTRSEDFQAIAEMCDWLAHPMEFGRAPADIRQVDTRELFWPPTNDRRRVWVFRYEYPPRDGEKDPDIGYGMVGSVTFALFGESTASLSPEQVYAVHCAWELEANRDPRAPKKRTVEAGLEILRGYNPDLRQV